MSSLEIYEKLRKSQKAVFTLQDIALLSGQKKNVAAVTATRLVKKGILEKVEKGKFCLKGEDSKAVACGIVKPSFISFRYALFLHGGTTQIPIGIQLACRKKRRPLEFHDERISFHFMPVKAFAGFELERGANGKIYALACKEKAVADAIACPALCPIGEAKEAVQRFGKEFDRVKCAVYLKAYASKSALNRLKKVLADES